MCHKNLFIRGIWVFYYGVYSFYWRKNYKNTEFWILFGVYYTDNPSSIFIVMFASTRILSLFSSPTCVKPNQCLSKSNLTSSLASCRGYMQLHSTKWPWRTASFQRIKTVTFYITQHSPQKIPVLQNWELCCEPAIHKPYLQNYLKL